MPGPNDLNYMPGANVDAPNANTPQILDNGTDTSAYNHLARLGDKLLGAVEFRVDEAINGSMRTDSVAQPAPSPSITIVMPRRVQTFISRNLTVLGFTVAMMVALLLFRVSR